MPIDVRRADLCHDVAFVEPDRTREAEARELGAPVLTDENVLGLHVAVDDLLRARVQVFQRRRHIARQRQILVPEGFGGSVGLEAREDVVPRVLNTGGGP